MAADYESAGREMAGYFMQLIEQRRREARRRPDQRAAGAPRSRASA